MQNAHFGKGVGLIKHVSTAILTCFFLFKIQYAGTALPQYMDGFLEQALKGLCNK